MTAMEVDDAERRARMVMSRVAEPGDRDACRLVREFSAVELIERLARGDVEQPKVRDWSERLRAADANQLERQAEELGAAFLCPGDDAWPSGLFDLQTLEDEASERRAAAPFGLWLRGDRRALVATARAVSIVGARAATAYGEHVAGDLASTCGARGVAVVSGGAYGVDAAAHRGALACDGVTVAVLAGGVDRLYPPGNSNLLRRITESGALISEAAPGCAPSRSRFLVRNRLIAALSDGIVVVEAALRSGSLSSARWARDLGRHVMGVPGPVTSRASAGVHELLRQPETVLITGADEIIEQISPMGEGLASRKSGGVTMRDQLDQRSRVLLDAVPKLEPATAPSIARTAGLDVSDAGRRLEMLELLDLVVCEDGAWRLADDQDG